MLNTSFQHTVYIQTQSHLIREVVARHLRHRKPQSELINSHSCPYRKARHRTLVAQVHLRTAAVVVTQRQVETLALRYNIYREYRMPKQHIIPLHLAALQLTRHRIRTGVRECINYVPAL